MNGLFLDLRPYARTFDSLSMEKVVIEPNKKLSIFSFGELLAYRELLTTMAWRDVKVKYVQTVLGPIWALLKPLSSLVVFILVFSVVAKMNTDPIPYPLFALSGLALWTFFSSVIDQAGNAIIGSQNMIKKIYFPRLIIPLSKILVCLVDFAIVLVFLAGLMIYYRMMPSANIVFMPLFVLLNIIAGLSIGLWVNALTIRYRDFLAIIPVLVQIGTYATPIAYSVDLVPEKYRMYFYLNPMTGIISGFRWCLFGGNAPGYELLISIGVTFFMLITGLTYFKKMERVMADLV